jgi:glutathione S-transferase
MSDRTIPARLITIPVSHYCEKTRWALSRLQVPFVEERHMPPFHRFATRGLGVRSADDRPSVVDHRPATEQNLSPLNRLVVQQVGGQSVPVLIADRQVWLSSDAILQYADAIAPADLKLYPTSPQQRQQVDQLVESFDTQLAPAVRLWTYSYIMNRPDLVRSLWCEGVPWYEAMLFPVVFPWMRSNVVQMYDISPVSAIAAAQTIGQIFDAVDGLLADGRSYLVGDRFSVADLAFATLAAAMVMPDGYGVKFPAISQLPDQMGDRIQALRGTAAGKFVLRLYQAYDAYPLSSQR